ncbi:flagellar basal body rod protein FlgC [Sansalvadorimonas sp. 2012CJ34-2]|uniref:Flagellar basal-body rod protein FlgC n=1 Tax=Parendozoicomonas callyspongiae TaxID=2942213 RepID=A0ABT0PFH2_9GAMM|nr:flagellar basal body rod protein FlgC [Sansalvadorimonas sp. 2012CJ34-2]MCL6270105.1 flagellar basal body rod protein FlgC [Sansalvadorimonas sp. 2012CJ34-2]
MSLNNIYNIAGSAMTAQSQRLNTVASNLANAETAGSSPETTYRARKPVFSAVMEQVQDDLMTSSSLDAGYSVKITDIVESDAPLETRYQPDHPMANDQGYVYYPNVNEVEEMADMMSASRSFQTNIEVLASANAMQERLLTLGK